MNNADLPRRNDLDGRGPLSQEELVAFARWFLEVCLDQAHFMGNLLGLAELRSRIEDLLRWLAAHPWSVSRERSVFGVPLRSLRFLFPRLWPEAEVDVD